MLARGHSVHGRDLEPPPVAPLFTGGPILTSYAFVNLKNKSCFTSKNGFIQE